MDYKSLFTRFLTSAKWQTSKSWSGAFARFACCLSATACLCEVVNCESFINCLNSWDILILISMLPTPFCKIWYLHVCNAFSPQHAHLHLHAPTCTTYMHAWYAQSIQVVKGEAAWCWQKLVVWNELLFHQLMNSCLPLWDNKLSPKISPKYQRAQKWLA